MPDSTTITIFGASGDLAHRKLIPALFNLYRKKRVPEQFQILGYATRPWDDYQYRSEMEGAARQPPPTVNYLKRTVPPMCTV